MIDMHWIYLMIAGLFEVAWVLSLKYSQGFTRPLASGAAVVLMLASFCFLSLAVRQIPVGVGYVIWTGFSAAGVAVFGVLFFAEQLTGLRVLCLLLILIGIAGLNLSETRKKEVGVKGFEPSASWSQTRRSSQAELHPAAEATKDTKS